MILHLDRNVGEPYLVETMLKDSAHLGWFLRDLNLLGQELLMPKEIQIYIICPVKFFGQNMVQLLNWLGYSAKH